MYHVPVWAKGARPLHSAPQHVAPPQVKAVPSKASQVPHQTFTPRGAPAPPALPTPHTLPVPPAAPWRTSNAAPSAPWQQTAGAPTPWHSSVGRSGAYGDGYVGHSAPSPDSRPEDSTATAAASAPPAATPAPNSDPPEEDLAARLRDQLLTRPELMHALGQAVQSVHAMNSATALDNLVELTAASSELASQALPPKGDDEAARGAKEESRETELIADATDAPQTTLSANAPEAGAAPAVAPTVDASVVQRGDAKDKLGQTEGTATRKVERAAEDEPREGARAGQAESKERENDAPDLQKPAEADQRKRQNGIEQVDVVHDERQDAVREDEPPAAANEDDPPAADEAMAPTVAPSASPEDRQEPQILPSPPQRQAADSCHGDDELELPAVSKAANADAEEKEHKRSPAGATADASETSARARETENAQPPVDEVEATASAQATEPAVALAALRPQAVSSPRQAGLETAGNMKQVRDPLTRGSDAATGVCAPPEADRPLPSPPMVIGVPHCYTYEVRPGDDLESWFRNVRRRIEVELDDDCIVQLSQLSRTPSAGELVARPTGVAASHASISPQLTGPATYRYTIGPGDDLNARFAQILRRVAAEVGDGCTVQIVAMA